MVWACGKNGRVPYGQKGFDVGSKWRAGTRETGVGLDGYGVKVALGNKGVTVEAACKFVKDREEWRALVHM